MDFDFTKNIVLENDHVLLRLLTLTDFENLKSAASSDNNLPLKEKPSKCQRDISTAFNKLYK